MILIRLLATFAEVLTIIGAIVGAAILFFGLAPDNSAIQTGASAATAVAFVAIPYTVAGAFHRMAMRVMKLEEVAALYADD